MSASAIATPLAARAGFAPASSRDVVGAGEQLRGPSVSGRARVATRPPGARLHRARRRGTVAAEAYGESDQRGNWWKPQSGQPRVSPPRRPPPTNLAALSRGGQIFDDPKHQSAPAARRALREISGQTRAAVCSLGAPASKRKDSAGRSVFERSGGFVYIRNFFSRCELSPPPAPRPASRASDSRACFPREISRLTLPTDLPTHADVISR